MTMQSIGAAAAKIVDPWTWYFAALKAPAEIGKSIPVSVDSPEQGYYRTRFKDKPYEAVAIWRDEATGQWLAYRNNREVDAAETWNWCCRNPISYEAYQRAVSGGGWADDDETVAAQIAPPPPGHNSGDVSEIEVLRDQIEAAKKGASAYAKITDDATLTKAQSLRARLNELSGEADKKREALKRPHLEAGKEIDKAWQPLVKEAKSAADGIRAAMSAYETEKLRKQREDERKVELARLAAEEEAKKAAEAGKPVPAPEPVAAPVPAAPAPIKGTYGKAASRQVKQVVSAVTDWAALSAYMLDHPELRDLLMKLAQRAVDAGRTVPGIELEERVSVS
ncbi:MAG: hypothetical protein E5X53_28305 [Mesorhizobium sp.]|uniref:hypothetical protein n=1 Tax=Mesorhizobium sp. TaxID=1871066 RepID=UPI0012016B96|nr:hypothetical protein [Mesorhizobium sp.]TIP70334.1 MAG: hypothetical protein E5X55_27845 [Mesorhizobium sp.]TIQ06731.1 MAG: hypothetical protein E5X57_24065 [Mesorhizobium sp.]TIR48628.1 MAG: hypothetical protein E5X53_28305 [Mesorhizobium sp.]TJV94683.1 MAG: hypothetical protein E5X52_27830 [Mesorhizobium sp.]